MASLGRMGARAQCSAARASTSSSSRPAVRPCRPAPSAPARQQRRGPAPARFFKFGNKTGADAGIYSSQGTRDDYSADDVEYYFNYMGCLAVEGTYDRMEAMIKQGLHPVDVILLMAAAENDAPKIEELLGAGADVRVRDNQGRSPLELATKDDALALLRAAEAKA